MVFLSFHRLAPKLHVSICCWAEFQDDILLIICILLKYKITKHIAWACGIRSKESLMIHERGLLKLNEENAKDF